MMPFLCVRLSASVAFCVLKTPLIWAPKFLYMKKSIANRMSFTDDKIVNLVEPVPEEFLVCTIHIQAENASFLTNLHNRRDIREGKRK
jgi:hypothetical protein